VEANAVPFVDSETGFTFASNSVAYDLQNRITVRVAIPSNAVQGTPYRAVIQVIAPRTTGWVGVAWGGRMVYNPLTLAWDNSNSVVISSRWAT
jgi:hypothetical protein